MLTDPAAHGIDVERTAVLYMATGSEWPETRLLVKEFMLPLLREHSVRPLFPDEGDQDSR
ncbi:hypothetical protein [Streptomyces sp. NPDC007856]|uniref:hypothetical protein n=1 Tax=Streptomyces sp. NPDC007856 TaxID=3364781 RepID=UPI00367A1668